MITKINFVASANSTTKKLSKRPTCNKSGLKKGRSSALLFLSECRGFQYRNEQFT